MIVKRFTGRPGKQYQAEWPSGEAGVCKTPYNGSIPFSRLLKFASLSHT